MYLRKQGRRIYLLQSYRDGQGRVRQRRLGHFTDLASWHRQRLELPLRCPELRGELDSLRDRAESMLEGQTPRSQPKSSVESIRGLVRTLLTKLAEEDDEEVFHEVAGDLQQLVARISPPDAEGLRAEAEALMSQGDFEAAEANLDQIVVAARAALPARRQSFDASDPKAQAYLGGLELLAEALLKQNLWQDAAVVFEERVRHTPTPLASCLTYGALLQRLGRREEALEQYSALPNSEAIRHYNVASVHWQGGRADDALVHLLRGFTCDVEPAKALSRLHMDRIPGRGAVYWENYGDLWDTQGRKFILTIFAQPWVRRRLRVTREQGIRARNLVSAHSRIWLLQRGIEAIT